MVSLMTVDGQVVFTEYIELRDSMNSAFAENVRMLMADRSRLVANAVRRTNGNHLELRKVVYSPCNLCKTDPSKPPAWQLKADEVTDDKDLKLLEFRDAVMEIDGWPIFYTPYMRPRPTPSVKAGERVSCCQSFGNSSSNGFPLPRCPITRCWGRMPT